VKRVTPSTHEEYDSSFKEAFAHLLEWEGGFVNHPNDPGGATNLGISLRYLQNLYKNNYSLYYAVFHYDDYPSVETIQSITRLQAMHLAYEDFWIPSGCLHMDAPVATAVFDLSFNAGVEQSLKIFQRALNSSYRSKEPLVVDGKYGPKTHERYISFATWKDSDKKLLRWLHQHRVEFYQTIVRRRPSFRVFLKGWLNRARSATRQPINKTGF